MIYCLQADLNFSTQNIRNQVQARLESATSGRPKWGVESLNISESVTRLIVETRFVNKQDLDAVVADIDAYLSGARLPTAGSWWQIHDCTHDATKPTSCGASTRKDY